MSDDSDILRIEVWVIPSKKQVLVTDFPGPPAVICGFVSEDARRAAQARGYATVSELGFPSECYLGHFPEPDAGGWGQAVDVAEAKAKELGYAVVYSSAWDYDDLSDFIEWDAEEPEPDSR